MSECSHTENDQTSLLAGTESGSIIHLVSDSTGETVSKVFRAALAQFQGAEAREYVWPFVHTPGQLDETLYQIAANPGLVLFTMVQDTLRRRIVRGCEQLGLPYISVLGPVMNELQRFLDAEKRDKPGRRHQLNDKYFQRMDAIDFTVNHDDGQGLSDIDQSDVVLLGVSRMSKTPCCIYLAYRGIKAANIPLVLDFPVPSEVIELSKMERPPMVIGLVQDVEQLQKVRASRLQYLTTEQPLNYADYEMVHQEVAYSRRIFLRYGWPIIDVTRRSVEETAAMVLQLLHRDHDMHDVLY